VIRASQTALNIVVIITPPTNVVDESDAEGVYLFANH
jgi:hypothetical protein